MFSPTLLTRLLERVVAFDLGKECWKRAAVVEEFGSIVFWGSVVETLRAAPTVRTLNSRK